MFGLLPSFASIIYKRRGRTRKISHTNDGKEKEDWKFSTENQSTLMMGCFGETRLDYQSTFKMENKQTFKCI